MRPLELTMSAFGPFADHVTVSMESLGRQGVFLITGPTGAGKTTLFDAMVFALYGEPSGDVRESTGLRCREAPPTAETFVKLRFALGDKEYLVTRSPQYTREAKRGSGTTLQKPEAELVLPGGAAIVGTKNVTQEICSLLGLDRRQYTSTAMIAQGDFLKLLLSGTAERSLVFQKLFHTAGFQQLQKIIKEDAAQLKAQMQTLLGQIERLTVALPGAQDIPPEQRVPLAQALYQSQQAQYTALTQQALTAQQNLDLQKTLAQQADGFVALTKKVSTGTKALQALQAQSNTLKAKEKSLPFLRRRIVQLTEKLGETRGLVNQLKEQDNLLEQNLANCKALQKQYTAAQVLKQQASVALAQTQKKLEALQGLDADLEHLVGQTNQCQVQQQQLLQVQASMQDYAETRDAYSKQKATYQVLQAAYVHKAQQCTSQELLFFASQAGVLAGQLQENVPCPVCGATQHPSPAKPVAGAPTQQQVEAMRQALEQDRTSLQWQAELCSGLLQKKETQREQVLLQITAVMGALPIEQVKPRVQQRLAELEQALAQLHQKQQALQTQCTLRSTLSKKLPQLQLQQETTAAAAAQLAEDLAGATAQCNTTNTQLELLKKALHAKTAQQAQQQWNTMQQQQTSAAKVEQALQQSLAACHLQFATQEAALATLQQQLGAMPVPQQGAQQQLLESEAAWQTLAKEKEMQFAKTQQYHALLQQVTADTAKLQQCMQRLTWVSALATTAEGRVPGKERLSFETYVQIGYFDMVIRAANLRFTAMTDGRYQLIRKLPDSLQSQCGLDLDVLDCYSGCARSVKTLSGGESFQASLCLALGLADVVQAHAGGVRIEAMFVDEGFGSLDASALDLAVRILAQLSTAGRLVGIISHVSQLQDRIERKIVVSPHGKGIAVDP